MEEKSFEHGLPPTEEVENVDTTIWGRVPSFQALVDNFSNVPGSRAFQDVGLDGLRTEDERSFFQTQFIEPLAALYGSESEAYKQAILDPSSDNYHYFRGSDYDKDEKYSSILNVIKTLTALMGTRPQRTLTPNHILPLLLLGLMLKI